MEDQGYIKGRDVNEPNTPGLPRRLYKVTGLGQQALAMWNAAQAGQATWGKLKPAGAQGKGIVLAQRVRER